MRYLARLTTGRIVLWCYLIWYVFFAACYFDPSPSLWLTSLGIAAIIGVALMLSVAGKNSRLDRWQIFRLFVMPFCVSSFAALVKGRGFILIFSPRLPENLSAIGACIAFCMLVWGVKRLRR